MTGELHHMHWRDLAKHVRRTVGQVDALIVDAPYSAHVHAGHGTMERHGTSTPPCYDGAERREINYSSWDDHEVSSFVEEWSPLVAGWFCAIADDELGLSWKRALRSSGRLAFPMIPCTERGSTVRIAGDGPSSQTTFLCVARPREKRFLSWGVTPSWYEGPREAKPLVGGKPLWLMERLVEDYTRPGDLVCDPCMGAGTTLLAAKMLGRRYIGGDLDESHVELARERLRDLPAQPKKGTLALPWEKP